jgi:membrane protease YdiL (CAAX protease family)
VVVFAIVCAIWLVIGASWQDLGAALTAPAWSQRAVFLAIGLQAAFVEESLFRGNLLPALARRMPAPVALVVTSGVFAVYHLNLAPIALLSKTLLGVLYGSLRGRDGSLVAPAIAHAAIWALAGSM